MKLKRFKDWKFNNGIPVLSDDEIEGLTLEFLEKYSPLSLRTPSKVPVLDILTNLAKQYHINVEYRLLGYKDDLKILGITNFKNNSILIEKNLINNTTDEKLLLMSIAHEIGHWVLHRHRKIALENKKKESITIDIIEIDQAGKEHFNNLIAVNESKELKSNIFTTNLQWVEHQAKKFAAFLLMPRSMFIKALNVIQEEMGINTNKGLVYIDNNRYNNRDYKKLLNELHNIFGTSKISIEYQLSDLKRLIDARKRPVDLRNELVKLGNEF
jgi:Zn-dependent peptidase ImmA (M78 family)